MLNHLLNGIHHIAIICANYERSKYFYTHILESNIVNETYRENRKPYKLNLALNDQYIIELFSFPDPPPRPLRPESCGLRHIAFKTNDIEKAIEVLSEKDVTCEPIRVDEITGKKFTFFSYPDDMPLELYQI